MTDNIAKWAASAVAVFFLMFLATGLGSQNDPVTSLALAAIGGFMLTALVRRSLDDL